MSERTPLYDTEGNVVGYMEGAIAHIEPENTWDYITDVPQDVHDAIAESLYGICQLCGEAHLDPGRDPSAPPYHRVCSLREVMGGIGHLLAHPYWCEQQHDPDAGLTRRQSAILVDTLVNLLGVEAAVARSMAHEGDA